MKTSQLTKGDGVIPSFFRQLHCYLFEGHNWKRVSPEHQGKAVYECTKCKKTKVDYWP